MTYNKPNDVSDKLPPKNFDFIDVTATAKNDITTR